MSVFKSLKGTLQSVQHGVSASIKRLSSTEKKIEVDVDTVDFNAGADLLNRFQEHWMELHKNSEENAKKAEDIDSLISSIYLSCEGKADALNALNGELEHIPDLIERLENITSSIAFLNTQCEETEKMLTDLEDMMEEQEMMLNKNSHHYQLTAYTERKLAELKQFRVLMAAQHAQRVKEFEEKKLAHLQERQLAFEQAFTQDLEHYKLYGSSPRQPSVSSNELDVGEIKIDEDEQALDEFLDSAVDPPDDRAQEEVFGMDEEDINLPTIAVATDEDIDTSLAQELKAGAQIKAEEEATDSEVDKDSGVENNAKE